MDLHLYSRMKDIFWLKMEWTNIYFYVLEILFMWIPMQGIKFRDLMSVVCTSNWNGSPASAKLKKKKRILLHPLHFCQCPCGSKCRSYHMLCILQLSKLSYFIAGQGKECTSICLIFDINFSYVSITYVVI